MYYEIDRIIYGRIEKTVLAARMNPIMGRIVIRESCSQLRGSWQMSRLSSINTEKGTKHSIIYTGWEKHFFIVFFQLMYNTVLVLGVHCNDFIYVYIEKWLPQ